MVEIRGFIDNTPEPDQCESKWGALGCLNDPEFLIITLSRPGFAIMCKVHKENFESLPGLEGYVVEPYSLGRAKALQAVVKAVYEDAEVTMKEALKVEGGDDDPEH